MLSLTILRTQRPKQQTSQHEEKTMDQNIWANLRKITIGRQSIEINRRGERDASPTARPAIHVHVSKWWSTFVHQKQGGSTVSRDRWNSCSSRTSFKEIQLSTGFTLQRKKIIIYNRFIHRRFSFVQTVIFYDRCKLEDEKLGKREKQFDKEKKERRLNRKGQKKRRLMAAGKHDCWIYKQCGDKNQSSFAWRRRERWSRMNRNRK